MTYKAPPMPVIQPRLEGWADVRGTGFNQNTAGGSARRSRSTSPAASAKKVTPDVLVGTFTGYENFNFTSRYRRHDDRQRRHHRQLCGGASHHWRARRHVRLDRHSTAAPPAPRRARLPARAGSAPAASPAIMASANSCSNPRRASIRCGSATTPLPTRSAPRSP